MNRISALESNEEIASGEAKEEESKTEGLLEAGLLDSQCRGCGVEMQRLLRHLNSKQGVLVVGRYSTGNTADLLSYALHLKYKLLTLLCSTG